jgi:hypothetical protein
MRRFEMTLEIECWNDEMVIPVKFPWPRRENLPESLLLFPTVTGLEKIVEAEEREFEVDPERWDGLS